MRLDEGSTVLVQRIDAESVPRVRARLSAVVVRLRQVPGSGWKAIDDPHAELKRLRQGSDEVH